LLDPNTLSDDGTIIALGLSKYEFSDDGELLAYALSVNGSDWESIRVKSVSTGQDYPEVLTDIKFSVTEWTHDNKGFFYAVSKTQEFSF
jgi:prolyl oligopeptidase